ncbi:helix-turn-helix transcriptional regulator [Escherichia coli]|uniref:helix-turn-helix transcriptional regulator n=1 Tax=Escherichia coli TaxID=562 RepID=UPI0038602974
MLTPVSLMDDQMVDMAFITQLTGLTDKWFYKLIKDGDFPAPIKMGRSSRWLKSEVEAWLQARIVTNGAIVIHTQRLKSDPGGNLLS